MAHISSITRCRYLRLRGGAGGGRDTGARYAGSSRELLALRFRWCDGAAAVAARTATSTMVANMSGAYTQEYM